MQPPDQSDELVIATPERVAFQYEIAGIGSRFLAQGVDMAIVFTIGLVITVAAAALGALFNSAQVALLVGVILGFVLVAGYFLISEAALSGQTVGKRTVRLRVVGDQGQPITLAQAVIRNLVRIVDFLPFFYGIGIITLFISGRGKRLGDFAAGTLVVRDRQKVSLYDLASTASSNRPAAAPAPEQPVASIWAQPAAPAGIPGISGQALQGPADPALRRLVVAYAARREELPADRRQALAQSAEPALRRALPDVVAAQGPLAALDQLAEREGISPFRPVDRNATRAMTWGILTLILFWFPLVAIPTGILSVVFARNGLRAIRQSPGRLQGADRAQTGRILGIIGLVISSLLLVLIVLAFIFRSG
ncbi:MAG TPA: RDD family protein [Candidatus Dormibacteraeota bacterium]